MTYDYLIVGAGLYGSVLAERLASILNKRVLVIDNRNHIGGNCYDEFDNETESIIPKYGLHIFHTNHDRVWKYLNDFIKFNNYKHKVFSNYKGKIYQLPFNLMTINQFFGKSLNVSQAIEFLEDKIKKENIKNPSNLEEKSIRLIGRELYEAFIKEYTIKQWNKDPKELPPEIITRIPVRFNYDIDYFNTVKYQGMPIGGYNLLFEKLLKRPGIDLWLNCDYFTDFKEKEKTIKYHNIIYTGPIDKFFDYQFGKLKWRGVSFSEVLVPFSDFQGTAVINYPELLHNFTRILEPKHLYPESKNDCKTKIIYEYPENNPNLQYYPIGDKEDTEIFKKYEDKYKEVLLRNKNIIIGGRLGDYKYYDMDETIFKALECFDEIYKKYEFLNFLLDRK